MPSRPTRKPWTLRGLTPEGGGPRLAATASETWGEGRRRLVQVLRGQARKRGTRHLQSYPVVQNPLRCPSVNREVACAPRKRSVDAVVAAAEGRGKACR